MVEYTLEVYNLNLEENKFKRLAVLDHGMFSDLSYSRRLNGIGECQFSLSPYSQKCTKRNFTERANQILVKRDGLPMWIGPYYQYDGGIDGQKDAVTFSCYSYMFHLATRYTDAIKNYTGVDQLGILRDLLTTVQSRPNGNLKILYDIVVSGEPRNRNYEFGNLVDLIVNFSQIIKGFDTDFVPIMDGNNMLSHIKLEQYYPKRGTIRTDLPKLQLGKNIQTIGFSTKGELFNSGITKGAGTGDSTVYPISTNDPEGVSALQKIYTRIETVRAASGTSTQGELDEDHLAFMNEHSVPRVSISLTTNNQIRPYFHEINLGDSLVVDAKATDIDPNAGDLIQFSGFARVEEIAVAVGADGEETVTPKVLFYQ